MDPYLEGSLWTTVHSQLAAEIARQLAPQIAPHYVACTEKRFLIAAPADLKGPHYWVEIRDAKRRTLVTAIELLSPFNKRGQGRLEYLQKRDALLASPVHLIEIDLLREGRRPPMRRKLSRSPKRRQRGLRAIYAVRNVVQSDFTTTLLDTGIFRTVREGQTRSIPTMGQYHVTTSRFFSSEFYVLSMKRHRSSRKIIHGTFASRAWFPHACGMGAPRSDLDCLAAPA